MVRENGEHVKPKLDIEAVEAELNEILLDKGRFWMFVLTQQEEEIYNKYLNFCYKKHRHDFKTLEEKYNIKESEWSITQPSYRLFGDFINILEIEALPKSTSVYKGKFISLMKLCKDKEPEHLMPILFYCKVNNEEQVLHKMVFLTYAEYTLACGNAGDMHEFRYDLSDNLDIIPTSVTINAYADWTRSRTGTFRRILQKIIG